MAMRIGHCTIREVAQRWLCKASDSAGSRSAESHADDSVCKSVASVGLLGRYRNQETLARLERVLAGAGRDGPSARTVRSQRRLQRLNMEEVRELVKARVSGAEIDDLAERFGIGRTTVIEHLKREGVPGRRWPGRTLNAAQLEEAGRLYETGLNLIAVAERFGVDRRYLRKALPVAGFTIRKAGQQKRQS